MRKMPLIGFTVLKDKLLDGSKTQTIRLPRKRPLQVGDKLYIYWKPRTKDCEKLGEAYITRIETKRTDDLTDEDARKDGFTDSLGGSLYLRIFAKENLLGTLLKLHPEIDGNTKFDIITWNWVLRKVI